jgi:alpha-1,3/alpha-1,6-mannosyltransferase
VKDEANKLVCAGTLDVRVRGNYLFPPSIFSRLTIVFAILRQLHLMLHIYLSGELSDLKPHSFIVDQLSAGIPLLQYLVPGPRILFYCHYPDLLLARGRASVIKRLYRAPFDWLERWSMGFAHAIAVNSEFTKGVVKKTWPDIENDVELRVVHPCIKLDEGMEAKMAGRKMIASSEGDNVVWPEEKVILSINRFERKKDVGLAIKAFAAVPGGKRKGVRLVIAGMFFSRRFFRAMI